MLNEPETYGGVLIKNIRLRSHVFMSTFSLPHNNMYEKRKRNTFAFIRPFLFSLFLSAWSDLDLSPDAKENLWYRTRDLSFFFFFFYRPAAIKLWQIAHSRQTLRTNKGRSREMEGKLAYSLERPPMLFWYRLKKKKSSFSTSLCIRDANMSIHKNHK